ncbi:3-phytase [Aulographum hederae CBS 113979]|uniref:3-phytase n=1 Tax=Aulographum hederae CBS 113979 TaxID=1176131 RepID=A0A6G1GM10_9PEZI|nr:3-phytase [Aulographum hederae CBS 113979]
MLPLSNLVALATTLLTLPISLASPSHYSPPSSTPSVNKTTCNGQTYTYESLAGYGFTPSAGLDKYGDNLGGIGSALYLDQRAWKKHGKSYFGVLWGLPDRGWNTEGTLNYQPRVHKFYVYFTPNGSASASSPAPPNLRLKYVDTIRFSGPDGTPCTGLDPDARGALRYPGFPDLPGATYTGDGFGGEGLGGHRVSVDSEGIVVNKDGSFWISDEYGPYVYKFDRRGKMTAAIRPPDAFIPQRNGSESFNAASPPRYDPDRETIPEDPTSGRQNNQGFEGLTISPSGTTLSILLQSALLQEGGESSSTRRNTRLLQYDISGRTPKYLAEYVVPLPEFLNAKGNTRVAAQSELHYVSPTQFLVLARDSGAGHGQDDSLSLYRHIDVFDISSATSIKSPSNDAVNGSIASASGVLDAGVTPAQYCSWLDFNVNSQLNKFGLHNGGAQDAGLLNEKWESIGLVPVDGKSGKDGEWLLFSLSDNDFVTQDGYMNGGKLHYADESGYNLDNQALVFKVSLPKGSRPV